MAELNDAGRNYYEEQFGGRIRQITKRGAAPAARTPNPDAGGCLSGVGRVGGTVIVIAVITAIRLGSRSNHSYTPPPQPRIQVPQFQMPQDDRFDFKDMRNKQRFGIQEQEDPQERINRIIRELNQQLRVAPPDPVRDKDRPGDMQEKMKNPALPPGDRGDRVAPPGKAP
jgi:hypothetical protein